MVKDIVYGEKFEIDSKDKKIIKSLYENGRKSVATIENETGIGRDSVNYRIKRLLKEEVISFISPILNPAKIGYPFINNVLIKTRISSNEIEERFIKKLLANPFITYIALLSGKWDFEIKTCSKNPEHFSDIIKQIRGLEKDYITDFEIFTIVKEPKYEDMTGII